MSVTAVSSCLFSINWEFLDKTEPKHEVTIFYHITRCWYTRFLGQGQSHFYYTSYSELLAGKSDGVFFVVVRLFRCIQFWISMRVGSSLNIFPISCVLSILSISLSTLKHGSFSSVTAYYPTGLLLSQHLWSIIFIAWSISSTFQAFFNFPLWVVYCPRWEEYSCHRVSLAAPTV